MTAAAALVVRESALAALAARVPVRVARPPVLATGIASLDALLTGGGLPRGQLTEIVGAPGSGKTSVLRRMVAATAARGLWVAYIDASRTLSPRDWAGLGAAGDEEVVWMVRPRTPARSAWCADVLLRSGAFALVILDGAPLRRATGVRLTRLARDAGVALVVLSDPDARGTDLPVAIRLVTRDARSVRRSPTLIELHRRHRRSPRPARGTDGRDAAISVTVEKGGRGGQRRTIEVSNARAVACRLCTHPEVPDRRLGQAGRRDAGRRDAGRKDASPVPSSRRPAFQKQRASMG